MKKFMSLLLSSLVMFSLTAEETQVQDTQQTKNGDAAKYEATTSNASYINWCESYGDAVKKSKASSRPILVLFTGTSWCPACMMLERTVLNKPEFIRAVNGRFEFYKAEFNDPSDAAMARSPDRMLMEKYNVRQFPTMVAIDNNGRYLFTINYQAGGPAGYVRDINQKLGQYTAQR